jgi:hypothetical protein
MKQLMVKRSYLLTVAVTEIVTNSTTEIGTFSVLCDTKYKIFYTGLGGISGSGSVAPLFKIARS